MVEPAAPQSQYTVIARRFRPQTFDDVVGQQHVARALRNAIAQGRVAHAYLFTGARGVGKTSMARILAKALNCPNVVDGVPCNQCDVCRSISAGQDVDISEIDGASNRGIDDIRQLRANVNVKSMRTKYKMYIIDEVHMLTKDAFNALLKTLEEPPPGVKFVFCTTEPNKVPDTILSRCQRFDFSTIETTNIIRRLEEIAEAEGFTVEPAAIELVARRAAGSMRDSQSIFDQLLAFGGEKISAGDVHRLLGTASDDRLIGIVQAVIDRQRGDALQQLDEALRSGVQLSELVDQLISYVRDLMVLGTGADAIPLLAVSPENRETLAGQAKQWGVRTILAAMEILAETKQKMFRATYGRALAEMALVRMTMLQDLERIDEVLKLLRDGAGALPSAGPARVAGVERSEPPVGRAPSPILAETASGTVAGDELVSLRSGSGAAPQKKSAPARDAPAEARLNGSRSEEWPASDAPASPAERPPEDELGGSPDSNGHVSGETGVPFTPGNEMRIWSHVIDQIHDMLKTHMRGAARVAISGPNDLDVMFPRSYHFARQYCEQPAQTTRLEALLRKTTGRPIRIRFGTAENAAVPEPKGPTPAASRRRVPETIDDPFVQTVMSVFGASVVRVESTSGSTADAGSAESGSEGTGPEGTAADVQ